MLRFPATALALLLIASAAGAAGDAPAQEAWTDADTGTGHWRIRVPAEFQLQLSQRRPAQSQAFFEGRGFTAEAARHYAGRCVLQSQLANISEAGRMEVDLATWRVRVADGTRRLRLPSEWEEDWSRLGETPVSRLAFRWSQLPTRQLHHPGDWFMGMITPDVAPGTRFDLEMHWRLDGVPRTATMTGVECAAQPDPGR